VISQIGKIISVTILREEYPQMWKQEIITGLVVEEDWHTIQIMNGEETVVLLRNHIMEVVEES
tara:strand:+ start:2984 stop:3172 length:189 start_codon:yes stop_codon:yes gene_type:complete